MQRQLTSENNAAPVGNVTSDINIPKDKTIKKTSLTSTAVQTDSGNENTSQITVASRQRSIAVRTDDYNRHASQVTEIAIQTVSSDERQREINDQLTADETIFILLSSVVARSERGATRKAIVRAVINEAACTLAMDVKIVNEKYKHYVKEQMATGTANTTS